MYIGKFLVMMMVVFALILWGCGKKETPEDLEFTSTPKVDQTFKTDASDIFDEFYKDDKSAPAAKDARPATASRPSTKPTFVENGRYVVQVSTVESYSTAQKLSSTLQNKGYPAYVAEVNNPTPDLFGQYYRVRIGGFTGISVARAFGDDFLRPEGYDFWVDNRANDNVGIQGDGFGTGTGSSWGSTQPQSTPEASPTPTSYQPESSWEAPTQTQTEAQVPQTEPTTAEESSWDADDWGLDSGW